MLSTKRALVATGGGGDDRVEKKIKLATSLVTAPSDVKKQLVATQGVLPRTSTLEAPTMLLTGHGGPVNACRFGPAKTGLLASGSSDKSVFLWLIDNKCSNVAELKGSDGVVLDIEWYRDGERLAAASAGGKMGAVFDIEAGVRVKRLRGHSEIVNSVCASRRGDPLLVTSSDDGSVKLWDLRAREAQATLGGGKGSVPVLSAEFSDDASLVFSGGIDENIKAWDARKRSIVYELKGHRDCVTGLRLSPDGRYLLSNAMDNTVAMWDVRAYAKGSRFVRRFVGHRHNMDKTLLKCAWSPDGAKVSAGSADRFVYVWDSSDGRVLYKLPGHRGSVNEVDFHPSEPVIASCSNDKQIYVGEIM